MSRPSIDRALRVQHEAEVYDRRADQLLTSVEETVLRVDPEAVPFPNREHVDFLSFALDQIGELAGRRILEVGCGGGALSVYLALQGANVKGIDVSEGMLARARARAEASGAEGVELAKAAVEDLRDPDEYYDVILGNQVLHHFELPAAAANLRRLLAPSGIAVFCEPVLFLPDVARRLRYSRAVTTCFPSRTDTPDERSISFADLGVLHRAFEHVECYPFQALCRLQNFAHLSDELFSRLERIDRFLLARVSPTLRLCRYIVVLLEREPGRRAATSARGAARISAMALHST